MQLLIRILVGLCVAGAVVSLVLLSLQFPRIVIGLLLVAGAIVVVAEVLTAPTMEDGYHRDHLGR